MRTRRSFCGSRALYHLPCQPTRFHSPLIEPDMQNYRIRLSDPITLTPIPKALASDAALIAVPAFYGADRLSPVSGLLPCDIPRKVRPLPSTGITRLPRYYEPLRLPTQPSRSLAGFWLIVQGQSPSRISRVAMLIPLCHAIVNHPGGTARTRLTRLVRHGLPLSDRGSASAIRIFEAHSTFTSRYGPVTR